MTQQWQVAAELAIRPLSLGRSTVALCRTGGTNQGNADAAAIVCLDTFERGTIRVTDIVNDNSPIDDTGSPAATQQKAPDQELELKLKKNPQDLDSKTDVGSDESMDASDPIASTQPGSGEPAPSSSFPEESSHD